MIHGIQNQQHQPKQHRMTIDEARFKKSNNTTMKNHNPASGNENDENDDDPYDISSMSEEGGEECDSNAIFRRDTSANRPTSSTASFDGKSPDWNINLSTSSQDQNEDDAKIQECASAPMSPMTPMLHRLPQAQGGGNNSPTKNGTGNSTHANHRGTISPAGSSASNLSPTNSRIGQPLNMPRFYDSEEEGAGSLVFVADNSLVGGTGSMSPLMPSFSQFGRTHVSPENASGGSGSVGGNGANGKQTRRNKEKRNDLGELAAPHLLPYHQRKKLSMKEGEGSLSPPSLPTHAAHPPPQPALSSDNNNLLPLPMADHRKMGQSLFSPRPPFPPKPTTSLSAAAAAATTSQPVAPSTSASSTSAAAPSNAALDKYKVSPIPPFKSSEQTFPSDVESSDNDTPKLKSGKGGTAAPSFLSPPKTTINNYVDSSPQSSPQSSPEKHSDRERPPLAQPPLPSYSKQHQGNSKQQQRSGSSKRSSSSSNNPSSNPNNPTNNPTNSSSQDVMEVICPPSQSVPNPPPLPPQPPSPRSSGYHIRIQSQGSISSLGSNAGVDNDQSDTPPLFHIGMGQPIPPIPPKHLQHMQQMQGQMQMPPPNMTNMTNMQNVPPHYSDYANYANYYHGYMQQMQQQQMGHYSPHTMPPYGPPGGVGPGGPSAHGAHGAAPPHPSVNFNDILGQDIATFLHGERIAAANTPTNQYSNDHDDGYGQQYPHPSQYNPHAYGWADFYQNTNQYQNSSNPPPQSLKPKQKSSTNNKQSKSSKTKAKSNKSTRVSKAPKAPLAKAPEPPPPPLTVVPNMKLHRARLPSISDDDWAEEFDKINKDDDEEHNNDGNSGEERDKDGGEESEEQDKDQGDHVVGGGGYHHPNGWNAMPHHPAYPQHPNQYYDPNAMAYAYYQHQQQQQQQQQYHQYQQEQKQSQDKKKQSSSHYNSMDEETNARDRAAQGGYGYPNEKSSLLASSSNRRDGGYAEYNDLGQYPDYGRSTQYRENDRYQRWSSGNHNSNELEKDYDSEQRKRNKKKSKRRRSKNHLINYSSNSSPDDEPEKEQRKHGKSRKNKGKRSHRSKRRGGGGGGDPTTTTQEDSLAETFSDSFMSSSLAGDNISQISSSGRSKSYNDTSVIGNHLFQRLLVSGKLMVCNTPLSAAAISFSIVLLGMVWLKWTEEILSSCKEVNFHSSQCSFPEFPGCYFCDELNNIYQMAVKFHLVCSYIAGLSAVCFLAKAIFFWGVFIDEMSSPITASPAGLVFMTIAVAFSGKGDIGEWFVLIASSLHLFLVIWFIYMSLAYQTMPDPSWFPNTIGIGLCAVKVWFYFPMPGHFLIGITILLTLLYYPISLIRVALNEKMSASICWMQMMCPAVSLYALAIILQPSFLEERPDISHFQRIQRSIYLPSMTCLFILCVVGMTSSVHGLLSRWKQITQEEFSPAHAAYSFPLLMHAIAVQSYLSSLNYFTGTQVNPTLKTVLHVYWIFLVVAGTFVALICIIMYLAFLPKWTLLIDVKNEKKPPAPNETSICDNVTYGESLIQPYVSPAILQANETGILVMRYSSQKNRCHVVRSRKVPALGFEPMMRKHYFAREREMLKLYIGRDVLTEGDDEDCDDIDEAGEFEKTGLVV